jgi:hypothetical protein
LLSELLINIPEDEMTNDALLLFQSSKHVQNDVDREDLLKAYRKRSMFETEDAIGLLQSIYDRSKVEDILFLAGEWAMESGMLELAAEIFSHQYSKPDLQQFAVLKLAETERNGTQKNNISTGFLKRNPQSIFSPQFRRILAE